jgi:predicted DNA-binding transcriptional regulator AlpA
VGSTESTEDDPLLSPEQVYTWLGVSEATLRRWRDKGVGPAYIRAPGGRVIRYRRSDVEAWLREHQESDP